MGLFGFRRGVKTSPAEGETPAAMTRAERAAAAKLAKAQAKTAKAEGRATLKLAKAERKASKKQLGGAAADAKPAATPSASAGVADAKPVTLLFLGCDEAGKTSIQAALRGVPQAKHPDPTNGFDGTGRAQRDSTALTLLDVGGGMGIRGIWPSYYADAHAAVFVVDASAPHRFAEAAQLLHEAAEHEGLKGKPLLVLAHKQDLPQACSGAELAEALRLHELDGCGTSCQVGAGSLDEGPSIGAASELDLSLRWVIGAVHAEYAALGARIERQLVEQKAREQARKDERKARLAAKRAAREKAEAEEAAAKAAEEAGAAGGGVGAVLVAPDAAAEAAGPAVES